MAVDFNALKRNRNKSLDTLQSRISKLGSSGYDDPLEGKVWKPTSDKAGNGSAIIRFLPAPPNEDQEFVRKYDHGFQGPGGRWFIEACPTTIGGKCPVCENNSELWNSGVESNKNIARDRKRRLSYWTNIYVVSDPKNPETEGKVFLYRFGKKIFDMIDEASKIDPAFPDEAVFDPFNFWAGANFRLRVRKVDGYVNYDKSSFDDPSEFLDGDEDQLKAIWESQHSLEELVKEDVFKSYSELADRLESVLGKTDYVASAEDVDPDEIDKAFSDDTPVESTTTPFKKPAEKKAKAETKVEVEASSDVDDNLAFFEELANS